MGVEPPDPALSAGSPRGFVRQPSDTRLHSVVVCFSFVSICVCFYIVLRLTK